MAGTEISEIKYINIANKMHATTTATVMVKTFHVNPAVLPVSTAIIAKPTVGIANIRTRITEAMPMTMPAPIANTIFIPTYTA